MYYVTQQMILLTDGQRNNNRHWMEERPIMQLAVNPNLYLGR